MATGRSPALVALLLLAACGSPAQSPTAIGSPSASVAPTPTASPSPEASPSPSGSGPSGTDGVPTSAFDLRPGDCFSASTEQIQTVTVVDCEQPHVYETFEVLQHEAGPDASYPGSDELVQYADTACQPAFEAFVGADYQTSVWYITSVTPTDETWASGDREVICTLTNEGQTEVTGSARGSNE